MAAYSRIRSIGLFGLRALGLLAMSGVALAHPGHEIANNLFLSGLAHPLTGFDHLFAMLAVGLWSALTYSSVRKAVWTPVSFLCLLLIGAFFGLSGVSLPATEPMIIVSLFILGLLIATRLSMPIWAGAALVGFFALFHGLAHGSELSAPGSVIAFVAGFMLTTFALHLVGLAAGFALKKRDLRLTRVAGVGIVVYGVSLLTMAA
ncbi:MAG: HupE/UreJ family protein [Burkholderiaceae bacterium]